MNEKIRLNYYDTSGQLVFIRFLEEFEGTKKTFRNKLTFMIKLKDVQNSLFYSRQATHDSLGFSFFLSLLASTVQPFHAIR